MDVGTILSLAQTLFAALQTSDLREMCSFLGYQSQLQDLQQIVETINFVLQDAQTTVELNKQEQLYIEQLKDAIYDADDLFYEFSTRVHRKHKKLQEVGKLHAKVRMIFSRLKELGVAHSMSPGVKEIMNKVDAIANNHKKFGFKHDSRPILWRREETCSYVYEQDIIGRESDKETIVGRLLDLDVQRDVSFLTIVGMGGLGKTTLAQLVFNDERIRKEFPMRLWACVADEPPKHFDVEEVLAKILESISGKKHDRLTMEQLQTQVRKQLARKFLLVLDDIWNEDRCKWLQLEKFFKGAQRGSWVVVTTRSWDTARIVGDESPYDLQGLTDEDSWHLFEKVAFEDKESQAYSPDLVEIGQQIVKKCANIPLAIRVAGSFLYGKSKNEWQTFQKSKLVEVNEGKANILPTLKLSYYALESQLKSCFSYCALFPKDTCLHKEELISLWMAQGYIVPFYDDQSLDDAGEQYFMTLLRRCFFQDVKKDKYGEIINCKMHDLMHDIAQEVTKKEIYVAGDDDVVLSNLDKKIRHLSGSNIIVESSVKLTKVRTFLIRSSWDIPKFPVAMLRNWTCIRALTLAGLRLKDLPESIGKLLHLRYLDLSCSEIMMLPKSITKLHNLQTIILYYCSELKELPNDFSKLVKLRLLDTKSCNNLAHMPPNMGKISSLHKLTNFTVNMSNSTYVDELEGLKSLSKLKGRLTIKIHIPKKATYVKGKSSEGGYLKNKKHLREVVFSFEAESSGEVAADREEALMEDMQPEGNVVRLEFDGYHGARMPSWAREDKLTTFFPNLVGIQLSFCKGLRRVPCLEKLRQLKFLSISCIENLEYMENENSNEVVGGSSERADEFSLFFPSLVKLRLGQLPKLKGWWRGMEVGNGGCNSSRLPLALPSFPLLSKLTVWECPELTSMPLCPNLETLVALSINERLVVTERDESVDHPCCDASSMNSSSSPLYFRNSKLRTVHIDSTRWLKSMLPREAFQGVSELEIMCDAKLERLGEVGDMFWSCFSSLRSLTLEDCEELESVRRGLEYLTALESLCIKEMPNLSEDGLGKGEEEGMPWRPLQHTLRSLSLVNIPKLVDLPEGLRYLTSLHSLGIYNCQALKSLPEWIPDLTSLTRLEIYHCSKELTLRCRSPSGSDWPHIQHIPHLTTVHRDLPYERNS